MNAMTELKHLRLPLTANGIPVRPFRQIDLEYDQENKVLWTFMQAAGVPCFNIGLLNEIRSSSALLKANHGQIEIDDVLHPVEFHVGASRTPDIFSYGGDLALFMQLIRSRDHAGLLHYARLCIDTLQDRLTSFDTNITTITLLQGEALGGGFESALASHVLIAEEHARMGFPEILFNLFPGMGAYSLLTRRVGARLAEEIILSGKIYTAQEMLALGLVDLVVPSGRGEAAVTDYVRHNSRRRNGQRALFECRRHTTPVSYDELVGITEVWVDAALRLEDKDLKMMGRLVRSQLRQQEASRQEVALA
jgi:DSF synthase